MRVGAHGCTRAGDIRKVKGCNGSPLVFLTGENPCTGSILNFRGDLRAARMLDMLLVRTMVRSSPDMQIPLKMRLCNHYETTYVYIHLYRPSTLQSRKP